METPTIRLHLILYSTKPHAIKKILAKVAMLFEFHQIRCEPYHKGGTSVWLEVSPKGQVWPDLVYDCISMAQNLGYSWGMSGNIDLEIELVSSKMRVLGVKWAQISMSRITP